jgi:hypothetical protein
LNSSNGIIDSTLTPYQFSHPFRFLNHECWSCCFMETLGDIVWSEWGHFKSYFEFRNSVCPALSASYQYIIGVRDTYQKNWSPNQGLIKVGIPALKLAPTVPAPPWCNAASTARQRCFAMKGGVWAYLSGKAIHEEPFQDQSSYLGIRYYLLLWLDHHLERTIPWRWLLERPLVTLALPSIRDWKLTLFDSLDNTFGHGVWAWHNDWTESLMVSYHRMRDISSLRYRPEPCHLP